MPEEEQTPQKPERFTGGGKYYYAIIV